MIVTRIVDTEPTWGRSVAPEHVTIGTVWREQNPRFPRLRRWLRCVAITVLLAIAGGLGTATVAAAWPWDWKDDATAYVVNFCGPMDIPTYQSAEGTDTAFGMNQSFVPESRYTYQPFLASGTDDPADQQFWPKGEPSKELTSSEKMEYLGFYPSGSQEAKNTTGIQGWANNPSYMRYGFSMEWFTYGISCGDVQAMGMNLVNNLILNLVQWVNLWALILIHYALDNVLYTFFSALVTPFSSIFGAIFRPFMFLAAILGLIAMFFKHKAGMSRLVGSIVWVAAIIALAAFLTGQPATVVRIANNSVTMFSSFAAQIMFTGGNITDQACTTGGDRTFESGATVSPSTGQISSDNPWQTAQALLGGNSEQTDRLALDACILENLWYGVTYQTWANGMLSPNGTAQARYAPALLNATYLGNNPEGLDGNVIQNLHRQTWNNGSYAASTSGNKNTRWGKDDIWNKSNFLAIVAAMCGSDRQAGDNSDEANDPKKNPGAGVWKDCQAGVSPNTDTADRVAYQALTGADWRGRMIIGVTGVFNAWVILISSGGVALYLIFKKFSFYFLLMFSAIFMAAAAWPGDRGKSFAKKFGSMLFENVIKQAVAVLMLLFISYCFALIMTPNAITGLSLPGNNGASNEVINESGLPYMIKPLMCLGLLAGLITFIIPMTQIVKAAVIGDANAAGKAVSSYGKTLAGAAVVTGAVVATGGAASGLLGAKAAVATKGALAAGKAAASAPGAQKAALNGLARVGRGTKLGKVASTVQQGMKVKDALAPGGAPMTPEQKESRFQSAYSMLNANPGKYGLAEDTGLVYGNGQNGTLQPSKGAWNAALADHDSIQQQGATSVAAAKYNEARGRADEQIWDNHRVATGSYHPDDVRNPEHPVAQAAAGVDRDRAATSALENRRTHAAVNVQSHLDGPAFVRTGVTANTVSSPSDVYRQLGIDASTFNLSDPSLDSNEQKSERGGAIERAFHELYQHQPGAIDPRHPAAEPLQRLATIDPNTSEAVDVWRMAAVAVGEHGMPPLVDRVGTTTPVHGWAQTVIDSTSLPSEINPDNRFELLQQANRLVQVVPIDSPVAERLQDYRIALADVDGHTPNDVAEQAASVLDVTRAYLEEQAPPPVPSEAASVVENSPAPPPAPAPQSSNPTPPPAGTPSGSTAPFAPRHRTPGEAPEWLRQPPLPPEPGPEPEIDVVTGNSDQATDSQGQGRPDSRTNESMYDDDGDDDGGRA